MTKRFSSAGKLMVLGLAVAAAVAMPLSVAAHGWGGNGHHGDYRGGHSGGSHGGYYDHDGYNRGGGHWSGGRWIAGAIVTGALIGLIDNASRPAPVYYDAPVVYRQPRTVMYEEYGPPVVRNRMVRTRTVTYEDPYQTRYVREEGDDDD